MTKQKLNKQNTDGPQPVAGTALLTKSLDIVQCIADTNKRLKIKEIAELTGYSKPTLYRILSALQSHGMVQQDPRDHAFALGPKFTELAGSIARNSELITLSAAALKSVAQKFGESVNLGILAGDAQQTVAKWAGNQGQSSADIGARKPLYCTAIGKALLAFMPATKQERTIHDMTFETFTSHTKTIPDDLREEISVIASRGFALDDEEIIIGTSCVAVPLLDETGGVLAAISVSGPTFRMSEQRRYEIAADLIAIANEISNSLQASAAKSATIKFNRKDSQIESVVPVHAFSAVDILDPISNGNTYDMTIADSAGGCLVRIRNNTQTVIADFNEPLKSASSINGKIIVLSGDTLWRVDPSLENGEPIKFLSDNSFVDADCIATGLDGKIYIGIYENIYIIGTDAEMHPIISNRTPGTRFKVEDSKLTYVNNNTLLSFDLVAAKTRDQSVALSGSIKDFVFTLSGSLWVTRPNSWAIEHLSVDGTILARIPLPVPIPTALQITSDGERLFIGSERISLPSAQLDLAPLSGDVFITRPEINTHP